VERDLGLFVSYLYEPESERPLRKINVGLSPHVRVALHRNQPEVWAALIEHLHDCQQMDDCDEFAEDEDPLS
jgi:hypothetical protein